MFREDLGLWMNRKDYREFKRFTEEEQKEILYRVGWYLMEREGANV